MEHQVIAQLLGNYGEFIGAIAVVASFGYLGIQIRGNTKSNYVSRLHSVQSEIARVHERVVADESFAELVAKSGDGAATELSKKDHARLQAWATQFLCVYSSVEHAYGAGQLDPRTYQVYCSDFRRILAAFPVLGPKMLNVVEFDQLQETHYHGIFEPLFDGR